MLRKCQLKASSFIYFIYSFMVFSISEITFGVEFGNRWSNELSSDGHLAPPGGGRFIGTGMNRTNSPNRSPNRSPKQKRRQTRMWLGQNGFWPSQKPTHFINQRTYSWPISSHMTLPISSNDFRFLMMKVEFLCTWWFFYFQNISDFLRNILKLFFINHSKIWNITLILIILFYRRDPRGGNFQCLTV